jgi:hypothetical protein
MLSKVVISEIESQISATTSAVSMTEIARNIIRSRNLIQRVRDFSYEIFKWLLDNQNQYEISGRPKIALLKTAKIPKLYRGHLKNLVLSLQTKKQHMSSIEILELSNKLNIWSYQSEHEFFIPVIAREYPDLFEVSGDFFIQKRILAKKPPKISPAIEGKSALTQKIHEINLETIIEENWKS